jgi:hypothetical protein
MAKLNSNYQISDRNPTKQIRIDAGLHKLLKLKAANEGVTVKSVLEDYLADILAIDGGEDNAKIKK